MGYQIKDLTFEQVQALVNENTVIVLPIGGGSKEHGNHLPMGTDYYVTDWIAARVTERCDVVTLLSMHAPFELAAKTDVYETYRAYRAFYAEI